MAYTVKAIKVTQSGTRSNPGPHPAGTEYEIHFDGAFIAGRIVNARIASLFAGAADLLAALKMILAEPHGCSLCDSGKPRNKGKGHQPDCGYLAAEAAIAKAESVCKPSPTTGWT